MNHWLLRPVMLGLLWGQLVLLGLISLCWNVVAALLYPLLARQRGKDVGRAGISHGYGLFWTIANASGLLKMDAHVLDPLRDEAGLIVVANHPSMLDALMLVARLPRSACVMKASLAHNPFLGPGARLARYIRNDSALGMVRQAVSDLKSGGQLVLFPEGTRTERRPVNDFRPGFTLIAKLANAPIQTVFIDTDSPYLGKGWPLWRLPPLPIEFSVRLGQRFLPADDPAAQLTQIQTYFAESLNKPSPPAR
jgi:1-acyl-sn-glycerol-3-phosphate acyltransferase